MEALQYSNKVRDAMTKKQVKGKKEIRTGYMVREVECSSLKIFLQS